MRPWILLVVVACCLCLQTNGDGFTRVQAPLQPETQAKATSWSSWILDKGTALLKRWTPWHADEKLQNLGPALIEEEEGNIINGAGLNWRAPLVEALFVAPDDRANGGHLRDWADPARATRLTHLRDLYRAYQTSDGVTAAQTAYGTSANDIKVHAWVKALANFTKNPAQLVKGVTIQGAGPSGLATALYAKKRGLHVELVEHRCFFQLFHIVTVDRDSAKGVASHKWSQNRHDSLNNTGMWNLLESLGAPIVKGLYRFDYKPIASTGGESAYISFNDLLYFLYASFLITMKGTDSATFSRCDNLPFPELLRWARANYTGYNAAAATRWRLGSKRHITDDDRNDAPSRAWTPPNDRANWAFVYADGAGSVEAEHFRHKSNVNDKFVGQVNTFSVQQVAESMLFRRPTDVITFITIIYGETSSNGCSRNLRHNNDGINRYCTVAHNCHGVDMATPFAKYNPSTQTCQVEVGFKNLTGDALIHAAAEFGYTYKWPYDTSQRSVAYQQRHAQFLQLILELFKQSSNKNIPVDAIWEARMWRSYWFMSTVKVDSDHVFPLMAAKPQGKQYCAYLVGDAARPALPDHGMGTNEASLMGSQVTSDIVAASCATYNAQLGAHELLVVRNITRQVNKPTGILGTLRFVDGPLPPFYQVLEDLYLNSTGKEFRKM